MRCFFYSRIFTQIFTNIIIFYLSVKLFKESCFSERYKLMLYLIFKLEDNVNPNINVRKLNSWYWQQLFLSPLSFYHKLIKSNF